MATHGEKRWPPAGRSDGRLRGAFHGHRHRCARQELAIFCSDADPYNPVGAQTLYADPLGITPTIIPGAGHITPDSGFGRWRMAEAWCLDGAGS